MTKMSYTLLKVLKSLEWGIIGAGAHSKPLSRGWFKHARICSRILNYAHPGCSDFESAIPGSKHLQKGH